MKALSIRQPWAHLIVHGLPQFGPVDEGDGNFRLAPTITPALKDIENRSWPLPSGMVGQRIYIHAARKTDNEAHRWLIEQGLPEELTAKLYTREIAPRGALVGTVIVVGQITAGQRNHEQRESFWFAGPYGFILRDPQPLQPPIPYKGRLGFFEVRLER